MSYKMENLLQIKYVNAFSKCNVYRLEEFDCICNSYNGYEFGVEFGIEFINFINKTMLLNSIIRGRFHLDNVLRIVDHFPIDVLSNRISSSVWITIDFIEANPHLINWKLLSKSISICTSYMLMDISFVEKYYALLDMSEICASRYLNESFIIENEDVIDFKALSSNGQRFSDEFYIRYKNKLCWNTIFDKVQYELIL